jgi:RNA polymerase sigma-70 factor (ECF subfamily)
VVDALGEVDPTYQAPVALFYLEERPYKEIAQILGVPMGTVKSRISRGIAQLRNLLTGSVSTGPGKVGHGSRELIGAA